MAGSDDRQELPGVFKQLPGRHDRGENGRKVTQTCLRAYAGTTHQLLPCTQTGRVFVAAQQ